MSVFLSLVRKDLLLELRGKDGLVLLFGLAILLTLISAFGIGSAFINPEITTRVFPAFLWIIFFFSATLHMTRSFDREFSTRAIDAIRMSGASLGRVYVAKVFVTSFFLMLTHFFTIVLLAGLLGVLIWPVLLQFLGIGILIVFAYACLSTLLAAMSATSRLKGLLLPLILLPLIFPLLASAVELSMSSLLDGVLPLRGWLPLLIVLDVLYFVAGINLFEFVIGD